MAKTMQTAHKYRVPHLPAPKSGVKKAKVTRSTKAKAKAKSSKAKETPPSVLFDTIVDILVGPEHVKYSIHKGLLCHRSAYFKGALMGNFTEASEGVVTLDDEDPQVFSLFMTWLYTGKFTSEGDNTPLALGPALQLYLFAEKRIVPGLQNIIIDRLIQGHYTLGRNGEAIHKRYSKILSPQDAAACMSVYENTDEGSKRRLFLVDFLFLTKDLEQSFKGDLAANFPLALITSILSSAQKNFRGFWEESLQVMYWNRCQTYHVHDEADGECKDLPMRDVDGPNYDDDDEDDEEEDQE